MKKFVVMFLVIVWVFASFLAGDYMGTKAQKDFDQRDIDSAHHAAVEAQKGFDACEAQEPMPEQKTR